MEKGTISICFVIEALVETRNRGFDIAAPLALANISEDLLDKPLARVSPEQYGALWRALAVALDDEFFGMDSHAMRAGSFAILTHSLLDCATLGHALRRMLHFFSLVLDDVRGEVNTGGRLAIITLRDRDRMCRLFAHGTLLVIVLGLASWLVGRRLRIRDAGFAQSMPAHAAEYRLLFGDTVCFDAPTTHLALDADDLLLPVIRDAASVRAFLSHTPDNFLLRYRNQSGPVAKVRGRLFPIPPADWPTFEVLAADMHTTPSTLRRRLDKEGASYQNIKDELRRDLAIHFLSNSDKSVVDIAYALGFADHSVFHRAFRKWTGASPGQYRSDSTKSAHSVASRLAPKS